MYMHELINTEKKNKEKINKVEKYYIFYQQISIISAPLLRIWSTPESAECV